MHNNCGGKTKDVTREQARDIADRFLQEKPWSGYEIDRVLAWDEIDFAKPCIYYVRPFDIEKCRIAYLRDPTEEIMLKSSVILAISRDTGEVHYFGSANDEG